jgi:hypothetical protein
MDRVLETVENLLSKVQAVTLRSTYTRTHDERGLVLELMVDEVIYMFRTTGSRVNDFRELILPLQRFIDFILVQIIDTGVPL